MTNNLKALGWFKYGKGIAKKCAGGGLAIIDKNHFIGNPTPLFYLSSRQEVGGYMRTSSKGQTATLAEALDKHEPTLLAA